MKPAPIYAARMGAASTFEELHVGMQAALEQAWASIGAGSLGIGAAACDDDDRILATGRNRINETDPGDDVLAGTSVAHAEMNVLAKLPFRQHDSVALHTTLQPCVQCLGAIRLSSVSSVQVLAPDPIFRGVERMRDLNTFVARRWPVIEQRPIDEWAAFGLLYPTHHMLSHPTLTDTWTGVLPVVTELVRRIARQRMFDGASSVVEAAERIWEPLGECLDEVSTLAADDGC